MWIFNPIKLSKNHTSNVLQNFIHEDKHWDNLHIYLYVKWFLPFCVFRVRDLRCVLQYFKCYEMVSDGKLNVIYTLKILCNHLIIECLC